jgi:predicted transcriptional regulator
MTKEPPFREAAVNHHLREIAEEAVRLQSRVMELTEQVYEAAGMSPGDRTLRGKVTGLFFGIQAHLEELNRLVKDTA